MKMGDKIREFWHDQIPGWFPIMVAIISAAFWIGQQQQHISDRLDSLEVQVKAIQEYIRTSHSRSDAPPLSQVQPQQESITGRTSW